MPALSGVVAARVERGNPLLLVGHTAFRLGDVPVEREEVAGGDYVSATMLMRGGIGAGIAAPMPRYFFDTRDGDHLIRDELGLELDGIEAARDEATRGMGDLARDALPGAIRRELAVQVRDESDRQILRASLWFEVAIVTG